MDYSQQQLLDEAVINKIHFVRGVKVMLDKDLAELYDVETKVLNQAVRRNLNRFPADFMFELTHAEFDSLRSQNVTLKRGQHTKYLPLAFTEQGVAMLSSVLKSERAIIVNIQIIRVFTKMREMLSTHKDLLFKFESFETQLSNHDDKIVLIFEYLKQLEKEKQQNLDQRNRPKIGFKND
jgi:hypothetical protein